MRNNITKSPYVKKFIGSRWKIIISTVIIFLLLTGLASVIAFTIIKGLTTDYTSIEVTVIGEHEERKKVRSGRLVTTKTKRFVDVTLADGSKSKVESEDIQVGQVATVLQSPEDGRLFEKEPTNPKVLLWIFAIIFSPIALVALNLLLYSLRGIRAVNYTESKHAATLQLTLLHDHERTKNNQRIFSTIVDHSTLPLVQMGDTLDLVVKMKEFEPAFTTPIHAVVGSVKNLNTPIILAVKGVDD